MHVRLDVERPRQAVAARRGQLGGQIGDQVVALLVGTQEVEAEELPGQAALQPLPADGVVLALGVDPLVEVRDQSDVEDTTLLDLSALRGALAACRAPAAA